VQQDKLKEKKWTAGTEGKDPRKTKDERGKKVRRNCVKKKRGRIGSQSQRKA